MTKQGSAEGGASNPWIAVTDKELVHQVQQLVDALGAGEKPEFVNIDVRLTVPSARAAKSSRTPPIVVVGDAIEMEAVYEWLRTLNPSPALLLFVQRYEAATLERAYQARYLQLRGVFRSKGFDDPDERGVIAAALKDAIRQHPLMHQRVAAKQVGWKIAADSRSPKRLVSLVLDRQMRSFVQSLEGALSRVTELPKTSKNHADRVMDAFAAIGSELQEKKPRRDTLNSLRKTYADVLDAGPVRPEAVLLEGESGTGKSLIADWISRRLTDLPSVRVPIVNVSSELLEAELFGSVAGAFTDAVSRPGVFHMARGRVVFLDEIGDATPEIQAKLLTFLDHFGFSPRGWPFPENVHSPVYIVAATNRNLRARVAESAFRADLYYRFRHRLVVPPLRARLADLRILIDFTLQDPSINGSTTSGRQVEHITLDAIEKLERYEFPGNFRELEDLLSRAVFNAVAARRQTITASDVELP